jgi:hypothetical protein
LLRSAADAEAFVEIAGKLERGGEVARADTVKARILLVQRRRDVEGARFEAGKARIGRAVLIQPDVTGDFSVVDDTGSLPVVPDLEAIGLL